MNKVQLPVAAICIISHLQMIKLSKISIRSLWIIPAVIRLCAYRNHTGLLQLMAKGMFGKVN